MSHKATNWVFTLRGISPGQFRVLCVLADCHNPSQGCFPSQGYLAEAAELSKASVNNHLNSLEACGLICREQRRDKRTNRQKSTRYILGFEMDEPQEPGPNSGPGAESKNDPEPGPKNGQSRVQNLDTNLVKEPVKNLARATEPTNSAKFWAKAINEGRYATPSVISPAVVREMLHFGLVTEHQLLQLGFRLDHRRVG